jgi:hypothetical protein
MRFLSRHSFVLVLASMTALLGLQLSASAQSGGPATGTFTVDFSGVVNPLPTTDALVVMHGSVGTGYYLDFNQPDDGTGGIVSLGPVAAGSSAFTVNYQYAPFETPVGVIIAGVSDSSGVIGAVVPGAITASLDLGVSTGFLGQNPLWLSPASFGEATASLSEGEGEVTVENHIVAGQAGLDPFLNNLGDLPLATSAFIPFAPNSAGTLVDFPTLDGVANGVVVVNPSTAAPLPSAFRAASALLAGWAILKLARKARAMA